VVGVCCEQAHVPAEQPSAREDARLPVADAYPRWPLDPFVASPQGTRRVVGLGPSLLPPERRVRRREDFTSVVRGGRRAGASGLVVHLAFAPVPTAPDLQPARAGFIVGRAVGSAVTRNRLRRQLRHLLAPRLGVMPAGTDVVVRASAAAAHSNARDLADRLDGLLNRALAADGTAPSADGTAPSADGTAPSADGTAPSADGPAPSVVSR
jgi:ribonuclease P protein component